MSELPKGWATACISDLADINPKQDFDDQLAAGFVPMSHAPINFRDKLRFDERNWGDIKKAYTNFKNGDVIFAKVTPCFENGKAAFVEDLPNGIGAGSSEFFVLRPSNVEVSAKYLLALVKSRGFMREGALNMTGAVGLRRVPRQFVENYPVLVPPAAEQTRIAQKLDELLAQVDTLKARLDAIPALLKRFRQSTLAAAVSGRLTEEWRAVGAEKNANYQSIEVREPWSHTIDAPTNWTPHIFEDVITLVGGSQPPKSEFIYEEAPGLVRLIQIRDYKSDNHTVFIRRDATKKFCSTDDVMIGRYGPPIFQILRGLAGAYNVALMKAVPLVGVLQNEYMYRYLQNYKILNFVEAGSDRTAGQSGVNKAFLEKYPIFLPPLAEQTEIVRRIEQLFAFADQLEAKVASAKSRIDHLTQSILAKAFRGELVPQDPNDEPASVLLKRIKAQRAAAPKTKRGRKASV